MNPTPVPGEAGDREPIPSGPSLRGRVVRIVPYVPALIPLALTVIIVTSLLVASHFHDFGTTFLTTHYNESQGDWGILIFVTGSFLTAVPALLLAMLVGLGIAIASTTYLPKIVASVLDPFVDLLAGIPSIVYGIWGFFLLAPYFGSTVYPWTLLHFGFLPGFGRTTYSPAPSGIGLPLGIGILFLMILPITTLLMRDALRSIPRDLWESGLALGATRWEVMRRIAIPYGRRGIYGAAFLGFGRAIGETVAVYMVIGNATHLPSNVYDTTSTMAAFIIGFIDSSYSDPMFLHFLAEIGLVLLAITLAVNVAGRFVIRRTFADVPGL